MAGYSRKHKFIQKISQHSNIRQDVVEIIIDAMIDVMIEEIINEGKFSFLGLFHIKSKDWKGYSFGNNKEQKVKDHQRLTVSLSKHLKELWKIRFDKFDGEKNVIDKTNWRRIYQEYGLKPRKSNVSERKEDNSFKTNSQVHDDERQNEIYNPFLEDDDEEY